ncbi:MAG: GAF domain-containing protein [Chloroflexi bacterium]|nr:GAF domain-containing protein [Chloroflexota bacterium]
MNNSGLVQSKDSGRISMQVWRERILSIFLGIMLIFGTLAYLVNIIDIIQLKQWGLMFFYTAAFLWVVALNLVKRAPYNFRAVSMLVIGYLLGPITLLQYGLSGDGRVWMLFFAVFASVLLGLRAGIFATILGSITYILIGFLMTRGIVAMPAQDLLANTTDPTAWLATGIVLLWLTLSIIFSLTVIVHGLENSLSTLEDSLFSEKKLTEELEEEHARLERRSTDLERRVLQIRTAADISRLISAVLDPQAVLQQVVDLVKERFDLYYVGVFLLDDNKQFAVLSAGTDEAGRQMLENEHKLLVGGSSMVGWAIANQQARIALDVGQDAIRFKNPYTPLTRSELALPLVAGEEAIGAITIQSSEQQAFDEDDITVLQSIADSLTTSIRNAELYQQIENNLEDISTLNRQYFSKAWSDVVRSGITLSYTTEADNYSEDEKLPDPLKVPLTLRGEQIIGNITLESERGEWTAEELDFIEAVSTQAALALENARLLEETQLRATHERLLSDISGSLRETLDMDSVLQTAVREIGLKMGINEVEVRMGSTPEVKFSQDYGRGNGGSTNE